MQTVGPTATLIPMNTPLPCLNLVKCEEYTV